MLIYKGWFRVVNFSVHFGISNREKVMKQNSNFKILFLSLSLSLSYRFLANITARKLLLIDD